MSDEMDVPAVIDGLNRCLALQRRSVLQLTTASGSMFGLDVQGVAAQLWAFAQAELADLRRLVEKVTALGGDPGTDAARMRWTADPRKAFEWLIEAEDEGIAQLHAVIADSGQEPRSEALEHLLEHLIMRKQDQVDWMRRDPHAVRRPYLPR